MMYLAMVALLGIAFVMMPWLFMILMCAALGDDDD